MASQSDHDWQCTKKTVLERSCHMFNNPLMSDITLTCGESTRSSFYAHKFVLATCSAVFYAMFYRYLAEKNSVLHLPDADEESLREFLRFLYTDQCNLTPETAMKIMYLAKKYIVPSLTQKCVDVVQASVKPENVLTVLEHSIQFDEKEMEKKCWEMVDLQSSKVAISDTFNDISQGTLIKLLQRDTLNIREIELFQAVLKWCENECSKTGLDVSAENKRAVLGDAIYQIRFTTMSQKEFAQHVSSSGLLTSDEIVAVYDKLNGIDTPSLKWKLPQRQSNALHRIRFQRFPEIDLDPNRWHYDGYPDRLSFRVNKPAILHGVRLFGGTNGSRYEVSLEVNGTSTVSGTYTSELNNDGIYGFDVMLPAPISVDQDKAVTMKATIRGPTSYGGDNGKESVVVDGVTVTFIGAGCAPTNGTNLERGQFPQIILSVLS